MSDLVGATQRAVAAAEHLTDKDAGAVEAALALARKIDAWDVIVGWAIEDAETSGREGARPKVPDNDNVSLSAYLKYMIELGLTPSGRTKLDKPKPVESGSKLAQLRSVGRGA